MPDPVVSSEQVKEALEQVANTGKNGEFPGSFTLGDGTVVKATNWEEAFHKAAEMKVNTATALRDREKQIQDMLAQHSKAPEPGANPVVASPGDKFDQKHYWELMNNDPQQAQDYIDAFRFGVRPDQVRPLFGEIYNVSQHSADSFEIQTFNSRNPDFPGTDEASDYILKKLTDEKRPLTAENMEYIYLRGVRDGEIMPLGEETQKAFIPPNLGGASLSQSDASLLEQVKNTPDDKLDDLYARMGLLKR